MDPARNDMTDVTLVQAATLSPADFTALAKPDVEIHTKHRVAWLSGIEGVQQSQGTL
jgi:hypothetical protein